MTTLSSSNSSDLALNVNGINCSYHGELILEQLSLSVSENEIVCLLGASGCGKTTLLKAIAGLLPLSAGKVAICGRNVSDDDYFVEPEDRNIGMIFQDYALFPHLTVAENIRFGLREWSRERQQEKVEQMLELVQLQGLSERYPHQLSGGQQQRVAIARALACEPDLLLLDEPFSNIDTQVRQSLIKEIRQIFKDQGIAAIFVTHSREEAFAFADKLAVMNRGVIEQFGAPMDIYHQPASRFVANFLGTTSYLPLQHPLAQEFLTFDVKAQQLGELLLRPQAVALKKMMGSMTEARENKCQVGEVIDVAFMGDSCRYTIQVEDAALIANSELALSNGQQVTVSITEHQPVIFS
ncbi:ABC transporter ATP-binding protein [Vibrio sp. SS-MA-C1-2]|uniref:ABC transporter ATP-binding protein n=1 Tax=Vibrio sp. SS-MA-C1-2 TaxID=2908646 RepID=UPI001F2DF2F9|nr:ABC transporter ATP-binding protein [Vibrio sp. SS-MA-C1-2]UJF19635.1 ABC transporter ATP-binding protein [Vibrio sp. SS-MA-C1-2]